MTLKQRMAAVRDECFGIGKQSIQMESAKGIKFTIQAHTVEAILAEIRPLFTRYRIDLTPNLAERVYSGNRCDVLVDFVFESLDTDESRVIRWAGSGTDNSDKGFAKAGTNALKEMLKKRFLVTDRDDAKEESDNIEHQADDGGSRKELEKVKDERRAAIQQWAVAFKAAIETAKDIKEVDRLKRDNRDQLDSDDLPEVTRTFFNELISERKAELE